MYPNRKDSSGEALLSALPAKRHLDLQHLIQNRGQMTVQDLSAHFRVSNDTIRRDLDFLSAQGRLTRTYGGAVANGNAPQVDSTFVQRMSTRNSAKKRIARAASRLIETGETLLIRGGSTTALFATEIERQKVTIVTNNLALAATMPSDRALYLLGGAIITTLRLLSGRFPFQVFRSRLTRRLSALEGFRLEED
jgi:DeoR/GlpR family transcriptional regulator of sugar metabolism